MRGLDLADGFDVADPQAWLDVEPADLVCLNAGVLAKGDGTIDDYRRILGVNVDGVVFGVRRLDRVMPKGSTIVVTASLAGLAAIPDDPVYPYGPGRFGAGCNMAVRRDVARRLGGFDEALDTGPPLPGGGDIDLFHRVLRQGLPLAVNPKRRTWVMSSTPSLPK